MNRPTIEESEEDEDPALYGYMSFLCSVLATLPLEIENRVKARTGCYVVAPSISGDRSPSVKGRLRRFSKEEQSTDDGNRGRGLVRELVEHCLFTVPEQRGNPSDSGAAGKGDAGDDDEVGHRGSGVTGLVNSSLYEQYYSMS